MFWKDKLASYILAQSQCDYNWLLELRTEFPQLRVKTIDARGMVPVICLSKSMDWQKPKEWAQNHLANVHERYREAQLRMAEVTGDNSWLGQNESESSSTTKNGAGDNSEVQELKAQRKKLIDNFIFAMKLVKKLEEGSSLSIDEKILVANYDESHPTYIV